MTLARKAATALTVALLCSPAPALAAAVGSHPSGNHHGRHHASTHLQAQLHARLTGVRHHVNGLQHDLARTSLTAHQRSLLTTRFGAQDGLGALERAASNVSSRKDFKRLSARIAKQSRLVAAQDRIVHWVGEVDSGLHRWRGVQNRMSGDDQRIAANEEDPQLMNDLDTAVADLDAAQGTLSDDEAQLLSSSGRDVAAMQQALHRVGRDLGVVSDKVAHALSALQHLETLLG